VKTAQAFSFNSPLGACPLCKGFGNTLEVDEELVVPSPALSIARGAIDPFVKPSLSHWQRRLLQFCKIARIDADLPYRELQEEHRRMILDGCKFFVGVRGVFKELEEEKYKLRIRVFISRYTSPFVCKGCRGTRLNAPALRVRVGGRSIAEMSDMSVDHLQSFFSNLVLVPTEQRIAKDILAQIHRRLSHLNLVGIGYLTLSRLTRSLSGGEYQRILLSTQLSQGLTDTLYVLDEPSIGLHPKDTEQLLRVLENLKQLGNSLVVVEHDPDVIQWADFIVDLGPGSGRGGGKVMFSGDREKFLSSDIQTAKALFHWRGECRESLERTKRIPEQTHWLELKGACANNLKQVDIRIPLKHLVAITGVSGSGKSTLIVDTLYHALRKLFSGRSDKIGRFGSVSGFEYIDSVELIDQSSIGRSSRSNPITFIKAYDEIRSLFAHTREAEVRHLTPGHFSFNVPGGRCDTCEGEGRVKIDMVFMEDVWVPCESCNEKKFKPSILRIRLRGKNIDEVLAMTVDEAFDFFTGVRTLRLKLAVLQEVGLGYLLLGQAGYTLSGGEAQRLKIVRQLVGAALQKRPTLFIFDEPTTGLHFNEIHRLIQVFRRLIQSGHSVIVIEHNIQLICSADYLIDLGPDGGDRGGSVVALGTPKEVAQMKLPHTGRHLSEFLAE